MSAADRAVRAAYSPPDPVSPAADSSHSAPKPMSPMCDNDPTTLASVETTRYLRMGRPMASSRAFISRKE